MEKLDKLFNKYGLNKLSHGCSTGSEWFSSGDTIQSYSPVDGKLIGEISSGSKKDFDHIIQVSKKAFKGFRETNIKNSLFIISSWIYLPVVVFIFSYYLSLTFR